VPFTVEVKPEGAGDRAIDRYATATGWKQARNSFSNHSWPLARTRNTRRRTPAASGTTMNTATESRITLNGTARPATPTRRPTIGAKRLTVPAHRNSTHFPTTGWRCTRHRL
jgi:hypothetical protein